MLKRAWLIRALITLNVIACLCVIAVTGRILVAPFLAKTIYAEKYKELMFQCDNTMRDHLIAKNRVVYAPSDEAIKALHAAEVGLLSCHDYDKLRKKLLVLGVSEHELAALGLEAIEERAKDVRRFVETHEFRY